MIFTVKVFIAGFHAKLHKTAELEFSVNVQVHMMLTHAKLEHNKQIRNIGKATRSCNINRILSALRCAYRNEPLYSASYATHPSNQFVNMAQPTATPNYPDYYHHQQHHHTIYNQERKDQNGNAVNSQNDNTQLIINTGQQH